MNGKAITAQDILGEVLILEKAISSLKTKLLKMMPPKYGSDAWWEESDRKAMEDIKNGNYFEVKNKKDLRKFLGL